MLLCIELDIYFWICLLTALSFHNEVSLAQMIYTKKKNTFRLFQESRHKRSFKQTSLCGSWSKQSKILVILTGAHDSFHCFNNNSIYCTKVLVLSIIFRCFSEIMVDFFFLCLSKAPHVNVKKSSMVAELGTQTSDARHATKAF